MQVISEAPIREKGVISLANGLEIDHAFCAANGTHCRYGQRMAGLFVHSCAFCASYIEQHERNSQPPSSHDSHQHGAMKGMKK